MCYETHSLFFAFTVLFFLSLLSCTNDIEDGFIDSINISNDLLDQVKSAYYSTTDGLAVKSSDYKDNTRESLFCLNGYSIDWDNPFYINSEYGVSVNIPVSTDKQYILKMEDGLGPYVSQLFCSISAIKSKKTCEIRFY